MLSTLALRSEQHRFSDNGEKFVSVSHRKEEKNRLFRTCDALHPEV